MARSVARALARIKQDLEPHLPATAIEAACRAAGHAWRDRKFGPVATVQLFVLQMLHANTAIRALRHLAGHAVNAAAYCEARARLPLDALQALLRSSAVALRDALGRECRSGGGGGGGGGADPTRWRGHRAFLVDATSTAVPDTPALRRLFKQPTNQRPGCGLPVPKVLALFDAMTGLVVEAVAFCLFVNEAGKAWTLHPLLAAGDLLVGDRAFCSFAQLALLHARGAWALFRVNQQIVSFRPHRKHYERRRSSKTRDKTQKGLPRSRWVRRLGKHDQVVAWVRPRPKEGPKWMTRAAFAALPEELLVREVRYRVVEKGRRTREVTVATTLLDPLRYPKEAIAELYGVRWRIETHFDQLKTTLGLNRLKCRSADGVRKELAACCLAYNLVHAVMVKAAAAQGTTADRIGFADALRWLLVAAPGEAVPALVVNPVRTGRYCPRVIKHVTRSYPRMTRPRHKYGRRPPPRKGKAPPRKARLK